MKASRLISTLLAMFVLSCMSCGEICMFTKTNVCISNSCDPTEGDVELVDSAVYVLLESLKHCKETEIDYVRAAQYVTLAHVILRSQPVNPVTQVEVDGYYWGIEIVSKRQIGTLAHELLHLVMWFDLDVIDYDHSWPEWKCLSQKL